MRTAGLALEHISEALVKPRGTLAWFLLGSPYSGNTGFSQSPADLHRDFSLGRDIKGRVGTLTVLCQGSGHALVLWTVPKAFPTS